VARAGAPHGLPRGLSAGRQPSARIERQHRGFRYQHAGDFRSACCHRLAHRWRYDRPKSNLRARDGDHASNCNVDPASRSDSPASVRHGAETHRIPDGDSPSGSTCALHGDSVLRHGGTAALGASPTGHAVCPRAFHRPQDLARDRAAWWWREHLHRHRARRRCDVLLPSAGVRCGRAGVQVCLCQGRYPEGRADGDAYLHEYTHTYSYEYPDPRPYEYPDPRPYEDAYIYPDEDSNAAPDEYLNAAANKHADPTANEHAAPTPNEHTNATADKHTHPAADEYTNAAANEHANATADEYTNAAANEHANATADEHANATADEYTEVRTDKHTHPAADEYTEVTTDEAPDARAAVAWRAARHHDASSGLKQAARALPFPAAHNDPATLTDGGCMRHSFCR